MAEKAPCWPAGKVVPRRGAGNGVDSERRPGRWLSLQLAKRFVHAIIGKIEVSRQGSRKPGHFVTAAQPLGPLKLSPGGVWMGLRPALFDPKFRVARSSGLIDTRRIYSSGHFKIFQEEQSGQRKRGLQRWRG